MCAFHFNKRQAKDKLEVKFDGVRIKHNFHPKYVGITMDRTLTFNEHLSTFSKKIHSQFNLVQRLAGSGCGTDTKTLRIVALNLVHSKMEYEYQIWCNSAHVK